MSDKVHIVYDIVTPMYGRLIRHARSARGLTQADLATIAGVKQSNISAIENERRVPTAATLHRLLFACGYELAAVAGEQVLAFPPPDEFDFAFDDDTTGDPRSEPRESGSAMPIATRVRLVTAVLDASEAILRER